AVGSVEQGTSFISTETALLAVILFMITHALIRKLRPQITQPLLREAGIAVAYGIFFYFVFTMGGQNSQQFIYFQF
ncbi:MAG TPA: hypothetical protein V6C99_05835, partial [Oculatellaceae cyanobacterium]